MERFSGLEVVLTVLLVIAVAFGIWYFVGQNGVSDEGDSDITIETDLGGEGSSSSVSE